MPKIKSQKKPKPPRGVTLEDGTQYILVSDRVKDAHASNPKISIETVILQHTPCVVIKATVITKKGTFTGHSYANVGKDVEKRAPYEVAETSAVGRALAFAGYGGVGSIASADEMSKVRLVVSGHEDAPPFVEEPEVKGFGK